MAEAGKVVRQLECDDQRHRTGLQVEKHSHCQVIRQDIIIIINCRKISRGSVWLDYKKWRQFLDELVEKKELDMNNVIERLENCRIPSMTDRITSANPRLLLS